MGPEAAQPAARAQRTAGRLCAIGATAMLAGCAAHGLNLGAMPETFSVGEVERFGRGIVSVDSSGDVVRFALAGAAEIALVSVTTDGRVQPLYPLRAGESSRFEGGAHTVAVPARTEWRALPSTPATASAPVEAEALRNYNRCRSAAQATMATRERSAPSGNAAADSLRRTGPGLPNPPERTDPGMTTTVELTCGAPPIGGGSAAPLAAGRWEDREDVILLVVSETPVSAEVLGARVEHLRVASQADLHALPRQVVRDASRPYAGYYSRRSPTPREQEQR